MQAEFDKTKIEDLLNNDLFVQWVKKPDTQLEIYWARWLEQNPQRSQDLKLAKEVILSIQYKNQYSLNNQEVNQMFEHIKQFKVQQDSKNQRARHFQIGGKNIWRLSVAASLFLFSLSLGYIFMLRNNTQLADREGFNKIETLQDVRKKITLPDGSVVKLNARSTLHYPTQFANNQRVVYLSGEAFFEIVKDAKRPFKVISNQVEVRVLGTSFNVRAYQNEKNVKVAVVSGRVEVRKDNISKVLTVNQIASIENQIIEIKKTEVKLEVAKSVAWKDEVLVFEQANFTEVFQKIGAWYGVEFEISSQIILKGHYTGGFKDDNLEDVLTGIAYTSGFQFRIEGKKVYIFK